jgi:hypothetical protein
VPDPDVDTRGSRDEKSWPLCDHGRIQRFIITIEGHGWSDFEEIELLKLPSEGDPIDTKFGTLRVESAEQTPEAYKYDGKIVCRMP